MAAWIFAYMDGYMYFGMLGFLREWITECMVACTHRVRMGNFLANAQRGQIAEKGIKKASKKVFQLQILDIFS